MNDDLKLALVTIAIMLVLVFIGTVALSLKLDLMEGNAKNRYLSTVTAVDFTRDKVKALVKKIDAIKEEDLLFIEAQLQDIRDNQFIIWKALDETIQNDIHYYSRDEWLENMSPEYREIFDDENEQSYIVSYEELALLVEDLVIFTGYNKN